VIADTWSIEELMNAEVLADLEGWGQMKRMVARVSAEIHNSTINLLYGYAQSKSDKQYPAPSRLTEVAFLPVRGKYVLRIEKSVEKQQQAVESRVEQTSKVFASLAGF